MGFCVLRKVIGVDEELNVVTLYIKNVGQESEAIPFFYLCSNIDGARPLRHHTAVFIYKVR